MKIATNQLDSFLAKPPAAVRCFLFYGPDSGQVTRRAMALAKITHPDLNDAFRVAQLTGSQLAQDAGRLSAEMAAQALGGGERLVLVNGAEENLARPLATLLADLPTTPTRLIILAGELGKNSKLRALAEGHEQAAALACYVAEGPARLQLIRQMASQAQLTLTPEAVAALDELAPTDQLALAGEIEKLALYAGEQKATAEMVQALIGDGSTAMVDDFVLAWMSRKFGEAGQLLPQLLAEGTNLVALLRALQRHAWRLLQAKQAMAEGATAMAAVKGLRPPVFWKQEAAYVQQCNMWEISQLQGLLGALLQLEVDVKSGQSQRVAQLLALWPIRGRQAA